MLYTSNTHVYCFLCTVATANSWTGWAVSSITSKFYKTPKSQATPTEGGAKGTAEDGTQRGGVAREAESRGKVSVKGKVGALARTASPGKGERSAEKETSKEKAPEPEEEEGWEDEQWEASVLGVVRML